MRILKFFLFITLIFNSYSSFATKVTTEDIKKRGFIRIGVLTNTEPFSIQSSDGIFKGFEIEMAKYLASKLFGEDGKLELVGLAGVDRSSALKAGTVDVVLANFTVTKQRSKAVDFSIPYLKNKTAVLSPVTHPIRKIEDLKGRKIFVFETLNSDQYLKENHPEVERVLHTTKNIPGMYKAFKENKDNAGMSNDFLILLHWANDNPGYEVSLTLGEASYISAAVDKGNKELLSWLDKQILEMRNDGSLLKFYDQEMKPAYGDKVDPKEILVFE